MKSRQMSINKLVIYLELATLGLTLVILFLSSLDHKANIRAFDSGEANKVVQAAKSVQKEANAPKTALLTDVHVPPRQREIWFGDLDGILQRGQLRILLPFSRTFFFQKNGQDLGLSSEVLKLYKQFLNDQVILGEKKIELVFLPTPQEQLIEDLLAGKGDIAVANMELPAVQEKLITFVSPIALEIQEILVTGAEPLHFKSIFNLSGQTITLREKSPYAGSLRKLNNTLVSIGRKPVNIQFAAPFLADEDLLEMTAAGLLPMTVVDSNIGELWAKIFHNLKLHKKIALRTAKEMTWILRDDSLLLQESISYFRENTYLPQNSHHELTEYYRKSGGFLKNNLRLPALERYHTMIELFEKYGRKYNFPSVLLAALGYQETELDSSRLGENGRVGLMGINPSAVQQEGIKVNLQRIQQPEENIHTAARYLRFLTDHYFSSPKLSQLDQNVMALAAYRTSPEQVMRARKKAALAGYNPDIWFNHVETAIPAEQEEDVTRYVRNIYNYMKAYVSFSKQNKTAE